MKICIKPGQDINKVGWGAQDAQPQQRRVLREKASSVQFEAGQIKQNIFLRTTGNFAERIDNWLGLPYHLLDTLPVTE